MINKTFIVYFRLSLAFVLMLCLLSCGPGNEVFQSEHETKEPEFNNPLTSLVLGKVVRRYRREGMEQPYKRHDAFAEVQIVEILRKGQNYHGQFHEGDVIHIFFNFTLDNTSKLFPELNQVYPGLKHEDLFQAELKESSSRDPAYSVFEYKIIESK